MPILKESQLNYSDPFDTSGKTEFGEKEWEILFEEKQKRRREAIKKLRSKYFHLNGLFYYKEMFGSGNSKRGRLWLNIIQYWFGLKLPVALMKLCRIKCHVAIDGLRYIDCWYGNSSEHTEDFNNFMDQNPELDKVISTNIRNK